FELHLRYDWEQAITPYAPFIFASRRCLLAEKPLNQFLATDFKMRSHVVENSGQCSHFERVVIRNRDMMLVALAGAQPQMTARFARDRISQAPQPFGKIRFRKIPRYFHLTKGSGVNRRSPGQYLVAEK